MLLNHSEVFRMCRRGADPQRMVFCSVLSSYICTGGRKEKQNKNICTPLSEVSTASPLKRFPLKEDRQVLPLSVLQAIDRVMGHLALCAQVASQAPQHFGSSQTQAVTCDGCSAHRSVYSVTSPQEVQR